MVMTGQTPFPHAKVSKEASTEAALPEILTAEEPTSALQEQLADILDKYLELLEQGQPEQAEALLTSQPHLEEPLREYLAGLKLLRAGAGPDDESDATLPNLLPMRSGIPAQLENLSCFARSVAAEWAWCMKPDRFPWTVRLP